MAYPCIRGLVVVDSPVSDTDAKSGSVRVHSRVLVCRSHEEAAVGVFAGFATRRPSASFELDADAQSFFKGIQLLRDQRWKK
jgi:hypothetical protein